MLSPVKSYRYFHLDVFTERRFGGNQLAVFTDGRGLSTDLMQTIAKEMNFSESAFVLPPERAGSDARLRIFTPAEELPMAGHPTIGAAFALAQCGVIDPRCDRIVFDLGIGPTPVSLAWRNDALSFAWMIQAMPTFGNAIADPVGASAALRLPPPAVAGTGLPVQVVSCGVPFVFVPIATRQAVDHASLDQLAYHFFRYTNSIDEMPVFLFSLESGGDKATVYSRMFAPGLGITEDPATGGASGALGCYLVRHKAISPDKARAMLSLQGAKMGRPSYLHIAIGTEDGEISSVRVGGESVLAGEGTLYV